MPKVVIYTTPLCGYCAAAKRLLTRKGVEFEEIDVSTGDGLRAQMMERADGDHRVPQIFIGNHHVGGFDSLAELEAGDELDPLLAAG